MSLEQPAAPDQRGVLYPARLPTFARLPAPDAVASLVRWFWIPEWRLAAGRVSRQHLIAFPACNLVVEQHAVVETREVVERHEVRLIGPATRRSYRDLAGSGWAVGALLRPAAVAWFTPDPAGLRDASQPVDLPDLLARVSAAMAGDADRSRRHRLAVDAFAGWFAATLPPPDQEALLANAMAELIDTDPGVIRVEDAAGRLHVSARTVQRLARRYVGLPPLTMIRRRRLQEAAQRLRADPGASLAEIARQLGYADQAHLATEFRTILGFTPSSYRGEAAHTEAASPTGDDRESVAPDARPPAR